MKILIYGVGGVGGYFGGKVAKAGYKTVFIARGEHMNAIRNKGLSVKSFKGDFLAYPTLITNKVEEVGKVDLVLLAVKSWQVTEAAKNIIPLLHDKSLVIPLQNGADNAEKLLKVLNKKHVLGGLCRIISFVEAPGKIFHKAFEPQVIFGELNNVKTERLHLVKSVFDKAGFDNKISDNIQLDIWKKFMFITTISGIGGLTRMPIDVMRSDRSIRKIMENTAYEIKALANAKNIELTEKDMEIMFRAIDKQAPGTTASMQRDIMEGKPSELDNFNGYIVKEGKRLELPTPINSFIYSCLLPMEKIARNES